MDSTKKPEKEHPREKAGLISQLFFIWAIKLLYKGSRKGLSTRDLTKGREVDNSNILGDRLEFYWREELKNAKKKSRKPNFRKVMALTFWTSFIVDGIIMITHVFIRSTAPLIVIQIILKFQEKHTFIETKTDDSLYATWNIIWNDVNWLCAFLVCAHTLACTLHHHAELRQRLVCARMRIACSSLIYRKMLRLSKGVAGKTPIGYIINLMSNDVGRIDLGFIYVHYIWILPFQTSFICYLTWNNYGFASIIGVIVLLCLTVPIQTGISRVLSKNRVKIAEKTDKRIGKMSELVQGIQVIKMYAWEKPFESIVAKTRKLEVKQIRLTSYLRGYFVSSVAFNEKVTLFVTIMSLISFDKYATPDLIFGISQFYSALQLTASIFYPLAVSFGAEAVVSIHRVEEFLLLDEHKRSSPGIKYHEKNQQKDLYTVTINKTFASWDSDNRVTLSDINLNIKTGTLCAVVGSVGAGKSSLLHLLLKELPITSGKVEVYGNLSYASQEPWLFAGTVRNNILFSDKYVPKRYNAVIKCCALLRDFSQLPMGDKTFITDKGGLSGGQRARISLARSVYKEASLYLFDDPLSAVDTHVGRHLFDEVIGPRGYLAKEKATRILITHQIHFLIDAEWIVILEDGKIAHQGTFEELAKNDEIDIFRIMERHSEHDNIATEAVNNLDYLASNSIEMLNIYEIGQYQEEKKQEEENKGKGSQKVWRNYLLAGCNYSCLALTAFVILLIFSQIVISGTDYFVNVFAQQEFQRLNGLPLVPNLDSRWLIYSCLIIGVIIVTLTRSLLFFKICMHSSAELHNRMFKNVLHATMRFFDINPSGRILNRFSRDIGVIDEFLPRTLMDCIQISLITIGILTLVSLMNPYLVAVLCIALMLYFIIFRLYIRASLDLKRLESICKSPVFSHTSSSLLGDSTIRSKNLERRVIREFDNLQDVHSAVWLSTMTVNSALGLWIDFVSCTLIAAVSYSFTLLSEVTNSASVGLAISQSVILANLVQYGVKQIAEALQWMTSVENVLQYNNIDQESDIKNYPPKSWPSNGKIEFKNMSLSYDTNLPPTLTDLQFVVEPTWKVGIVGRSGAGKSSLINALFRLFPIEGEIFIDNIETGSISLSRLRSCISIIPQDPVLFSQTLRYNLDPFEKYSDAEMLQALDNVELKLPLDFMVSEGGANFSAGERQLICLARSILRHNKIMVLDEATANVDPQTDALIQKTIRNKFNQCSVLTIAHRLHTIMDSDRVLVMDAGSVAEYDHPHLLLLNSNGIFRDMVDAAGPRDAANLKTIAEETYKQKKI